MEKLYTVTELAELFGVTRQTIHLWIEDGRFPNHFMVGRGGGKMILIPADDVEKVKEEEAKKLVEQLNRLGFQAVSA